MQIQERPGFTLLEILLAIAIMVALTGVALRSVNVRKTLTSTLDAEHVHYQKQIENAMYQHLTEKWELLNDTQLPVGKANAKPICRYQVTTDSSCVNLDGLIPGYVAALPVERRETNPNYTGYTVYKEVGRVHVLAAHLGEAVGAGSGVAQAEEWVTNGVVRAVVRANGNTYIGGPFTQVSPVSGGPAQARNHLAAFDANGALLSWNPNVSGWSIDTMAAQGSLIYVGGNFTSIGGQMRNHIAAIDATTGAPTGWNPSANGQVYVVAPSTNGTVVYAGGLFNTIGGAPRVRLAALDASTGNATSWNPQGDGEVGDIAFSPDGSIVYVAGQFTNMGGQPRLNLAALSAATATATAWNPAPDDQLQEIEVVGATAYVAGAFTVIGGQPRNYFAAVDTTTGAPTGWNPGSNGNAYALTVNGSTVTVGGFFTSIGGQPRNHIAALDATTGAATSWNPNANDYGVDALVIDGGYAYVGGQFTTINGLARANFARITAAP